MDHTVSHTERKTGMGCLNLIDPFFLIGPVHLASMSLFIVYGPFFLAGPLYLMDAVGNKR
jgi:hypothetical protein